MELSDDIQYKKQGRNMNTLLDFLMRLVVLVSDLVATSLSFTLYTYLEMFWILVIIELSWLVISPLIFFMTTLNLYFLIGFGGTSWELWARLVWRGISREWLPYSLFVLLFKRLNKQPLKVYGLHSFLKGIWHDC